MVSSVASPPGGRIPIPEVMSKGRFEPASAAPRSYVSAGFDAGGDWAIQFRDHREFIKCYAVVSGQCWLCVEGVPDAIRLKSGDCFVLPSGRPFRLASDPTLPPVDAGPIFFPARSWRRRLIQRRRGSVACRGAASASAAIMPACCWGCCRPSFISTENRIRRRCDGR